MLLKPIKYLIKGKSNNSLVGNIADGKRARK